MIIWAFYLQIWIYTENLIKVLSLSICSILKNKYQAQTLFQKNDVNSRCKSKFFSFNPANNEKLIFRKKKLNLRISGKKFKNGNKKNLPEVQVLLTEMAKMWPFR